MSEPSRPPKTSDPIALKAPLPGPSEAPQPRNEPVTLPVIAALPDVGIGASAPPPHRPSLRVVTGLQLGSVFPLEKDKAVLGRSHECDVRFDDLGVSRRHARILREGSNFYIEDLGSRNGTYVQNLRTDRHALTDGIRIGLGPHILLRFAYIDELEEGMLRRLYESAVLDALTGAHNRKYFDERIVGELAYAKRHRAHLSLILFDIDHFKQINDSFGHPAGDRALKTVVGLVRKALRTEDVLTRIGGEEFAIIARGIDVRGACALGERVRVLIEKANVDIGAGRLLRVTVSVGVASLVCCGADATAQQLVSLADRRLYEAKERGRNCTVGGSD